MKRLLALTLLSAVILLHAVSGAYAFTATNNIGIGHGIPFGGDAGLSYELEVEVSDSFSIGPTLAYGAYEHSEWGWNAGVMAHFLSKDSIIRPSIMLSYGPNTLMDDKNNTEYATDTGISYGVGARVRLPDILTSYRLLDHYLDLYVLQTSNDIDETRYDARDSDTRLAIGYIVRY